MPWTDMYVILSPDPCNAEEKKSPLPTIAVNDALDVLWHDLHHAWDLRRITMALFSFGIFIAALFVHVPTRTMYSQSHTVLTALAMSGDDTVTENSPVKFLNIEAISDILEWLNGTFVPQVFVTEDPYNELLPENEWGRIARYNQVLGGVSLEVTQMHKHDCTTEKFLRDLYGSCHDSDDVSVYEFVIPYNSTADEARTALEKKGDWLNVSTKELLITVPTLNSEIPGYVVTTLKLDFKGGGYIKPSFTTTPTRANHYPNTRTIVLDILVVLWLSPWMLILTIAGYTIKRHKEQAANEFVKSSHVGVMTMIRKCIFPDGWLAIDVLRGPIVHAFYLTIVVTQLAMTDTEFQNNITALQAGSLFGDEALLIKHFKYITRLSVWARMLATAAVFIQGLRVLNTFRNHVGLSLLSRSIWKAICCVCCIWSDTFRQSGTRIFLVADLNGNLCNMLFGNFDFGVISDVHYSVAFYWSFMALETFVLLNIVLAIVIDAYSAERVKKERTKWWRCRRVLVKLLRGLASNVVDLLPSQCWSEIKQRHQVVFLGRIRSKRLRQVLRAKLDTQDIQLGCEWTSETVLTVEKLEQLFPEASESECEHTIKYLSAGICHDAGEHGSHEDGNNSEDRMMLFPVANSSFKGKHDNSDSTTDTGISTLTIGDSNRSIQKTSEIQDLVVRLEKMERLNLDLQQKIDLLVEKMVKQ